MTIVILIILALAIFLIPRYLRKRKRDAEERAAIQEYLRQYREVTERDGVEPSLHPFQHLSELHQELSALRVKSNSSCLPNFTNNSEFSG